MDEILDEVERPLTFTNTEIFTEIWLRPRAVFKFIEDHEYDKYVYSLLIFAGMVRSFDRASLKSMGDHLTLPVILGTSIVLGGMLGWISFYLYASLLSWTGKWIGGKADTWSILRMLAYAMIPSIVSLFFLFLQILYFGIDIFKSEIDLSAGGVSAEIIFYTLTIAELIFGIVAMIFVVIGLSEVQQLTIGKAIVNLLVSVLVIVVPLVLIGLLFWLAFS